MKHFNIGTLASSLAMLSVGNFNQIEKGIRVTESDLKNIKEQKKEKPIPTGCKRFRFLNTEGDEIFTTIAVSQKSADKKFQKFLKQNGLTEV